MARKIVKIPNTNQIVPSAALNNNFGAVDERLTILETATPGGDEVVSEIYLGDPDVDGSWRFKIVSGSLKAQLKVAGAWTNKGGFTP